MVKPKPLQKKWIKKRGIYIIFAFYKGLHIIPSEVLEKVKQKPKLSTFEIEGCVNIFHLNICIVIISVGTITVALFVSSLSFPSYACGHRGANLITAIELSNLELIYHFC
jgi:hypothetical protein